MKVALMKTSVCELMYQMRDAVEANNIAVALYISRQIHDKLLQMASDKQDVDCKLECHITEERRED